MLTVIALRLEGRRWWCACGQPALWKSDVWSSHCSQHLLDPYSFTHFSHGLIFCGVFTLLAGLLQRRFGRTLSVPWQLCVSVVVAALWEIAENSPFVIERYRSATMSLDYLGDSIANSLGDIGCCALGFVAARKLGWVRSLIVFVVIELVLLAWIRDNLTLNVVMLVWPIHAIKAWQTAGHVPV